MAKVQNPTTRIGDIIVSPRSDKPGFRVNVAKKYTGKRFMRFFASEATAISWAAEKHEAHGKVGAAAFVDKPVVDTKGVTVSAIERMFLESRTGTAGHDLLKNHLAQFSAQFGGLVADAVAARSVRDWLSGLKLMNGEPASDRTKYGIYTSCSQMWKWAIRYDFANTPLFQKVEPPKKGHPKIEILTPAEFLKIYHSDMANDYTRAWLALGAFAGLRSCEIMRMTWEDVKEKQIFIRPEVIKRTKGLRQRYVPRSALLNRFLGSGVGRVIPVSETTFRYHTKRLAGVIGRDTWPHNCLRDSAASYMLADCRNAGEVATFLGHTTWQMVFANYTTPAEDADVEAWKSMRCAMPAAE